MAYITDAPNHNSNHSFFDGFSDKLGAWLEKIGTYRFGADRLARMEALNAKTDAQLADMGIRRQDIARVVCPHMAYI